MSLRVSSGVVTILRQTPSPFQLPLLFCCLFVIRFLLLSPLACLARSPVFLTLFQKYVVFLGTVSAVIGDDLPVFPYRVIGQQLMLIESCKRSGDRTQMRLCRTPFNDSSVSLLRLAHAWCKLGCVG